jgi:AraC-like DNA-binding protein
MSLKFAKMGYYPYLCIMLKTIIVIMPLAICGILTIQLLLSWFQHRTTAKLWLVIWGVVATLLYGGHYVFFCRATHLLPVSDSIYVACNLAVYPLYLIYIYNLTARCTPLLLYLGTFVIPALAGITVATIYAMMTPDETSAYVNDFLYQQAYVRLSGLPSILADVQLMCRFAFAVEITAVVVLGIFQISKYNKIIEQSYADTEGKALYSVRHILILMLCSSVVSFIINIIGRSWFVNNVWLLVIPSLLFSVLLFTIGWVGLWQDFSIVDILKDEHIAESSVVEGTSLVEGRILKERLVQTMEKEQLFLQTDLKLNMLARKLGTNRTYLLQTMGSDLHMTFSEYINRLRIAYAEDMMAQHPEKSKNEVAMLSGYSSLSSFYRNWKLYGKR